MPLWKFVPIARPDDPTWQDRPVWYDRIVRAETAAEARVQAARYNRDPTDLLADLEKADLGGGFLSEKLYEVYELDPAEAAAFPAQGEPGVVQAGRPGGRS